MTLASMPIDDDVVRWLGVPLLFSPAPDDELYPCLICDRMMRADELAGHWEGPAETAVWVEQCADGCEGDDDE